MKGAGSSDFELELFEYGYLVQDTDPCATTMEIMVPKLQGMTTGSASTSTSKVDKSAFANSSDSQLQSSNTSTEAGSIVAKVAMPLAHRHSFHDCPGNCVNLVHSAETCHTGTSTLKVCHHFHHDHHFPHLGDKGKIPANSKVIVLFMNHDPKDAWVTRICCEFPDGATPPPPPDEHR